MWIKPAALDEALARLATDPREAALTGRAGDLRLNAFNDWSVIVRISAKVTAGKQSDVARPMRQLPLRRCKRPVCLLRAITAWAHSLGMLRLMPRFKLECIV